VWVMFSIPPIAIWVTFGRCVMCCEISSVALGVVIVVDDVSDACFCGGGDIRRAWPIAPQSANGILTQPAYEAEKYQAQYLSEPATRTHNAPDNSSHNNQEIPHIQSQEQPLLQVVEGMRRLRRECAEDRREG